MRLKLASCGLLFTLLLAACSQTQRSSAEFCEKMAEVTGPAGVEAALVPGDPARIDGLVGELAELHDRAPEDISATTRTLLTFFRDYQRAPRDERRDVLADNEPDLIEAAATLNDYALDECGLLLGRAAPTSVPTSLPSIEVPETE